MEILIKIWSDSVLFSSNFLHLKQLFVNKVTEQWNQDDSKIKYLMTEAIKYSNFLTVVHI